MNVYARQFVEQLPRPSGFGSGHSTHRQHRATQTRRAARALSRPSRKFIHFVRLLFSRLGIQYWPDCQLPVEAQTRAIIGKKFAGRNETRGDLLLLRQL